MADNLDTTICPKCGSTDWYISCEVECELEDNGTGKYSADCHCKKCNKYFGLDMYFNYSITKIQTEM